MDYFLIYLLGILGLIGITSPLLIVMLMIAEHYWPVGKVPERIRALNLRIGRISRWFSHKREGSCGRCKTTWDFVQNHVTSYYPKDCAWPRYLCSALCEKCWRELTPDERLPYYAAVWNSWDYSVIIEYTGQTPAAWGALSHAIINGG